FAVDSITETTAVPSPYPESKFYMEIRITNRIYNTTLEDQESAEYATLRHEVDQLINHLFCLKAVDQAVDGHSLVPPLQIDGRWS
ncbi:putative mucin-17-like, partial [Triplophysa rosa]